MAHLKFNGEIVREGNGFAIKIEIGQIPSMAEAQQIGKFLHEAVTEHFESRGAVLLQSAPERKPGLILQS
jgi:hypothetical protein